MKERLKSIAIAFVLVAVIAVNVLYITRVSKDKLKLKLDDAIDTITELTSEFSEHALVTELRLDSLEKQVADMTERIKR